MNMRILIVDDDMDFQEAMADLLRGAAFEVNSEGSAEAALESLGKEGYDVIFLDLQMPGMGGMAALPLIKTACPRARIVMITAMATIDSAAQAIKHGADDYITKPFKFSELLTAIRDISPGPTACLA
jgi:DNA-binding NtrC family response regulator